MSHEGLRFKTLKEAVMRGSDSDQKAASQFESRENPELFRASLGLDFGFVRNPDGSKRIVCYEINGHRSGIQGIQKIPVGHVSHLQRLFARSRETFSDESAQVRDQLNDIWELCVRADAQGDVRRSRELKKMYRDYDDAHKDAHYPKFGYRNPPFIETISDDKSTHATYIPKEMFPKIAKDRSDLRSSEKWIVKPKKGSQGRDIYVMHRDEITSVLRAMRDDGVDQRIFFQDNVVQAMAEPLGADRADPAQSTNPASLRLLIDFRYMSNGTIAMDFVTGYQRVSRHAPNEIGKVVQELRHPVTGEHLGDFKVNEEDIYVVNKSRGASAVAMSDEEYVLALEASKKIIAAIGEAYRRDAAEKK